MKQTIALFALAAIFATAPVAGQEIDLSQEAVETVHAAGDVHVLVSGPAGNVGVLVGDGGVLIVDDQMPPLTAKVAEAIDSLSRGGVRYVLNTHWHFDHTGGNPRFGPEAEIIAHHNVRRRVSTPQTMFGEPQEPLPPEGWPVITFGDSLSVWFAGEEVRAMHLPHGHTDGDAVVWFTGSNVVHMGDQFFADRFPFIDLEHGGTVDGYIANVARVLDALPEGAVVIPGHGDLSDVEGLRRFHRMLVATRDHVKKRVAAGKSLEDIRAEGLPDEWSSWAWDFIGEDDWIGVLHAGVSGDGATLEYREHGHRPVR